MIRDKIRDLIQKAVQKQYQAEPEKVAGFFVERPKNIGFGDLSFPAIKFAGQFGKNPLELARELKEKLAGEKIFSKIEVKEPGFLNFTLSTEFLRGQVERILEQREDYSQNNLGQGQKIQVEFISANPTGPLTLGNGRGGIFGDVLSNIFEKSGHQVAREYYINDAGHQIEILGHSVLKDDQAEYKGEYIDELAGKTKGADAREVGQEAVESILTGIKETAQKLGITFDRWFSEQTELRDKKKVEEVFDWLKKNDLIYEKEGALWFKSKQFGDEKDRVLQKKDGQPTYFGVDCAYHKNKFRERKFNKVINVWGADHHGDVARLKGFVNGALGVPKERFEIILMQFVRLIENGQEKRMSKRKGVYVTVEEVLAEVGQDAFRFFMTMYAPTTHMDFDLALAKQQSSKNPVYYVQYGHARINSIFKKAKRKYERTYERTYENLELLKEKQELDLIRQLIKYPEIIEDTAKDYQVQRIPQYAMELVAAFHKFYECCRVINDDQNLQAARLNLLEATRVILRDLLENVLGISAPEKM